VLSAATKKQRQLAEIPVTLGPLAVSSLPVQLGQAGALAEYQVALQIYSLFDEVAKLGSGQYPILEQTVAGTLQFPLAPDYHEKLQQLGSDALHQETVLLPNSKEPYLHALVVRENSQFKNSEVSILLRIGEISS